MKQDEIFVIDEPRNPVSDSEMENFDKKQDELAQKLIKSWNERFRRVRINTEFKLKNNGSLEILTNNSEDSVESRNF